MQSISCRTVLLLALSVAVMNAGMTKVSLKELSNVDLSSLSCASVPQIKGAFMQWKEAINLEKQGALNTDLEMLQQIKNVARSGMDQHDDLALIEATTNINSRLSQLFDQLALLQSQQDVAAQQCNQLRQQIQSVMDSDDPDSRRQCCAMLFGLVEYLINQVTQLQSQCQQAPTIINIDGNVERLEIIQGECCARRELQCEAQPQVRVPTPARPVERPVERPTERPAPVEPERPREPEPVQPVPQVPQEQERPRPPAPIAPALDVPQRPDPFRSVIVDGIPEDVVPQTPVPADPQPVPPPPVAPIVPELRCVAAPSRVFDAAFDQSHVISTEVLSTDMEDVSQYGYGFWMRFMTHWPSKLYRGRVQDLYFVSSLVKNDGLTDLLTVHLGRTNYRFTTNDARSNRAEVNEFIQAGDNEGLWSYVYFSYGEQRAVAFVQSSGQEPVRVAMEVTHQLPSLFRFILGGRVGETLGFNGQFSRPVLRIGAGSIIDTPQALQTLILSCNPVPHPTCTDVNVAEVIGNVRSFSNVESARAVQTVHPFPEEYAFGGWFRWNNPQERADVHSMVRLTIVEDEINQNNVFLGDRDLAVFVGRENLQLSTYSYTNMNGDGNSDVTQNVLFGDQLTQWHYVYFGYSRSLRRAFAFVEFRTGRVEADFTEINHFLSQRQFLYVAKDNFYPSYSGRIARLEFLACDGAFDPQRPTGPMPPTVRPIREPTPPPAVVVVPEERARTPAPVRPVEVPVPTEQPRTPAIDEVPLTPLLPPSVQPEPLPELPAPERPVAPVQRRCVEGEADVLDAAYNAASVTDAEITGEDLRDVSQYGYSFWMRYLTRYPVPLLRGKTEPFYFVARLTSNNPYGNVAMGDRLLAVFQGHMGYQFATNDVPTDNTNMRIEAPFSDIEGVWTFVSFTYSHVDTRAVAFIKYGLSEPRRMEMNATHNVPTYLRFVLGGNDFLPGFNGQFARPVLRVGAGSFVDTVELLEAYQLQCNPVPSLACTRMNRRELVGQEVRRIEVSERPVDEIVSDAQLPEEYAVYGWFKWIPPTQQQQWHLVFRTTINDQQVNENAGLLGDRELAVWVGQANGGVLSFATYSYDDLVGNGNPNAHQNVQNDNNRISRWHFIYYGYSRSERQAVGVVHFGEQREVVSFNQVNHFLSARHFIYLAMDRFYSSYSGAVAHVNYLTCTGAFDPAFIPPVGPQSAPRVPTPQPVPAPPALPREPTPPPRVVEPTPAAVPEPVPEPERPAPVPEPEQPVPVVEPERPTEPVVAEPERPVEPVVAEPERPVEPVVAEPERPTEDTPIFVPTPESEQPAGEQPEQPEQPVFENECVQGSSEVAEASVNGEPVADIELSQDDLSDASEYGYGFWLRFLTKYPNPMEQGLNQPYYFVSRLTKNIPYQNVDMGDRVLALFQSPAGYHFATMNVRENQSNVHRNIPYGQLDIEGMWTYVYFSYSSSLTQAVGFVVFDQGEPQQVTFDVAHSLPTYLRFILAGTDGGNYPGFNGQISRPVFRIGEGAFLGEVQDVQQYALQCNPQPPSSCSRPISMNLLPEKTRFEETERQPQELQTPDTALFPQEYAVQGWFQWREGAQQEAWHMMFRLSSNQADINRNAQNLGDRVLTALVGSQAGGVIALATYSYADLGGRGNPNLHQSVPYRDQLARWHHVYFAYSRVQRSAIAYIEFGSGRVEVNFDNVNHYLVSRLFFHIAKDQFYPSYTGRIAHLKVDLCRAYDLEFRPVPIELTAPLDAERPERPRTPARPDDPTELCRETTPYIDVTNENIDSVIEILQQQRARIRQGRGFPEDQCYCYFRSDEPQIQVEQARVQSLIVGPQQEQPQSYRSVDVNTAFVQVTRGGNRMTNRGTVRDLLRGNRLRLRM